MNKEKLLKKLTSRKFLISLITVMAGMALLLGADSGTVEVLAAAAMTIVPAVVYCWMEGKVDAVSVGKITQAVEETAEKLGTEEAVCGVIRATGEAVSSLVESEKVEVAPQLEEQEAFHS